MAVSNHTLHMEELPSKFQLRHQLS